MGGASEADHFEKCPTCGHLIDCRDLAEVMEHEGRTKRRAGARDQPNADVPQQADLGRSRAVERR